MAEMLTHEKLFREELGQNVDDINKYNYLIFGVGALGSRIVDTLVRHGVINITICDFDRIEASNLGTQPWFVTDIGKFKTDMAARNAYNINKTKIKSIKDKFDDSNFKKFVSMCNNKTVIIDALDNFESRELVKRLYVSSNACACVHVGMSGDGYGQVKWDENYEIPKRKREDNEEEDICEYPLATNLCVFTATLCADAVIEYVLTETQANYDFTLFDKRVIRMVK